MAKSSKKLSKFNVNLEPRKYSEPAEGALDINYYVKAQMKDDSWHLAKIVDCRILKTIDPKKKKNDYSYEYYIHFIDYDRRMDMWQIRSKMEPTRDFVEDDAFSLKKQKGDKEHEGLDPAYLAFHEKVTRFKTINSIQMGKFWAETWYYSPYPQYYQNIDCLYICEFCLGFQATADELARHLKKCELTHPPGDEIYRHNGHSIFEVDGFKNSQYCENLVYLSKLFLDHQNVYDDVLPFLYYVLTENDEDGQHMVGYFSKEKESKNGWNLSCIMVFPFQQRKGYGKFLITFSYELSIIEKKPGGPETPLSDLGRASYMSWWTQRIIDFIREHKGEQFSISDISKETMITEKDIYEVLVKLISSCNFVGRTWAAETESQFFHDLY